MDSESQDDMYRAPCLACGKTPGARAYSLSKMVERQNLEFHALLGVLEHGWVATVLDAETLQDFCNRDCWQKCEPDVRSAWRLKSTFNNDVPITPCCRCGTAIDRRQPHVTLGLSDEELLPGNFVSATTYDSWDYAVLCMNCGTRESIATSTDTTVEALVP